MRKQVGRRTAVRTAATTAAVAVALAALGGCGGSIAPARLAGPTGPAVTAPAPADPGPRPSWAPAATASIRPGVRTTTRGGGSCTAGFVFTAGGRVYLGQAAHCAGTGRDTDTDGCRSATMPLGTPVVITGADGRTRAGALAYSSWVSMQADGESDPVTCASNDFALVAIEPSDAGEVNPSVPIFGGPTGIDTDGLRPGEPVYGYGRVRGHRAAAGVRPTVGTSGDADGHGIDHLIYSIRAGVPGDSGSGVLSSGGAAVGLLTTLHLQATSVSEGVTDLAQALDYAEAVGGLGDVELALGTETFDPQPPGVPLTDLATPAGPPLGL